MSLPRAICAADEPEWEHAVRLIADTTAMAEKSGLTFRATLLRLRFCVARDLDIFEVRVIAFHHDVGANDVADIQCLQGFVIRHAVGHGHRVHISRHRVAIDLDLMIRRVDRLHRASQHVALSFRFLVVLTRLRGARGLCGLRKLHTRNEQYGHKANEYQSDFISVHIANPPDLYLFCAAACSMAESMSGVVQSLSVHVCATVPFGASKTV